MAIVRPVRVICQIKVQKARVSTVYPGMGPHSIKSKGASQITLAIRAEAAVILTIFCSLLRRRMLLVLMSEKRLSSKVVARILKVSSLPEIRIAMMAKTALMVRRIKVALRKILLSLVRVFFEDSSCAMLF